MANDYYNANFQAQPLTVVRSDDFNGNNAAIVAGFETLPSELDVKRAQFGTDNSVSAALYEVTVPNLTVPYYDGLEVTWQAIFQNTGAANISINGNPIVGLVDSFGDVIPADAIRANQAVTVIYLANQNSFQIISTSTATADLNAAKDAADEAQASAAAALISETNAATSEANAAVSEANAAVSEANAAASAALARPARAFFNTDANVTITGNIAFEYVVSRYGLGDATIDIDAATLEDGDYVSVYNVLIGSGIATITNNDGTIFLPDGTDAATHTLTGKGSAFLQKITGTSNLRVASVVG